MSVTINKSTVKRVYFHNIGKMKWAIVPLVLGLGLMLSDLFYWYNAEANAYLSILGLVGQIMIYLTLLLIIAPYLIKKTVVQWNSIGMHLKLDSYFGVYIPFKKVSSLEKQVDKLIISLSNGKEYSVMVNHFDEGDIDKLIILIKERINKKRQVQHV